MDGLAEEDVVFDVRIFFQKLKLLQKSENYAYCEQINISAKQPGWFGYVYLNTLEFTVFVLQ